MAQARNQGPRVVPAPRAWVQGVLRRLEDSCKSHNLALLATVKEQSIRILAKTVLAGALYPSRIESVLKFRRAWTTVQRYEWQA